MIELTWPIKTISEANRASHEHWRVRAKRAKEQRTAAAWAMSLYARHVELPCTVTLTRISPGLLDDDNLASAFKHVRDGIADALNIDDRSPLIAWRYQQQRGKRGMYAVCVQVEKREAA